MERVRKVWLMVGWMLMVGVATHVQAQDVCDSETKVLRRLVDDEVSYRYGSLKSYFEMAYGRYPSIPQGVLESVAYTYTRFGNPRLDTLDLLEGEIPRLYSVMGLTLKGKGFFRENLRKVSFMSGSAIACILEQDSCAIFAYAKAFSLFQHRYACDKDSIESFVPVFKALSELPEDGVAMKMSLYALYYCLADSTMLKYGIPRRTVDFDAIFGEDLKWLQASRLRIDQEDNRTMATDYENATWKPAASCNYSSGRSVSPTNIVVHYTSGTYAGAIAWFQNCNAQASAHYVVRSFDGQVTQMVRESDKAWHIGTENGYTIGIEHEAYGNVASFFTPVMYNASAELVRDICHRRMAINPHHLFYLDTLDDGTVMNVGQHPLGGASSCTQIRGHQHYPNQTHTDPGPYWNWNYYYKLINRDTPVEVATASSGVFTDSGGPNQNYGNDERRLFRIHVEHADSVVLDFLSFQLQQNSDFIWIYNGKTVFDPLIGRWNTLSPGRVVASGEDMLVEFRSDCQGTASGWVAQWSAVQTNDSVILDSQNPTTQILWDETRWMTHDTSIAFRDTDDVDLSCRFFQVIEYNDAGWTGAPEHGFICDNFDAELDSQVWTNNGWRVLNQKCQSEAVSANTSLQTTCHLHESTACLFDFYMTMLSGDKFSCLLESGILSQQSPHQVIYQMLFDRSDRSLTFYRIINGERMMVKRCPNVYYTPGQAYLYRVMWDREQRSLKVYRHASLIGELTDTVSLDLSSVLVAGFSTEHTSVALDNVRMYRSRTAVVDLSVGGDVEKMVRRQASSGMARCKLKSIVVDAAGKFSSLVEKGLKVDYTPPQPPAQIYDKPLSSWWTNPVQLKAEWSNAVDMESPVVEYQYLLVMPTLQNQKIVWESTGVNRGFQKAFRLPVGNTVVKVAVKARNEAGLWSDITQSNGALYRVESTSRKLFSLTPNPTRGESRLVFAIDNETSSLEMWHWVLCDLCGRELQSGLVRDAVHLEKYPEGVYLLKILKAGQLVQVDKIMKYK